MMSHRFDSGNSALGVLGGSAGLSDEAFLVVNVRRTNLGEVGSLALPGLALPGLALPGLVDDQSWVRLASVGTD
jgi:hypothetical protein